MYLSGIQSFVNQKIPSLNYCPEITLTKEDAYYDRMKDFNGDPDIESTGLIECYCNENTSPWRIIKLITHNFGEFPALNT